jgi:dTDP-4-dehydrorhamnose reductase
MKILVTGKNGQLGSEINSLVSNYPQHQFHFTGSAEFNLSSKESMSSFLNNHLFDLIINCAAYTAVDKAEDDAKMAEMVNIEGVHFLAEYCVEKNIKIIHISTDYVFDGSKNTPYIESDITNPTGVYGETKRKGEIELINSRAHSIIIRTSWVYSTYGNNFVKTMLKLGSERESLNVVIDQIGTPTYAKDLANACLTIANQIDQWKPGCTIYHYSNEGVTSWYDFAHEIMSVAKLSCKVSPIETYEYPTKAKRPHFSVLNKKKIRTDFNLEIPNWKESLQKMLIASSGNIK